MKKMNLIISLILLITFTTNVIGQVANPTVQIIGLGTTNPTNSAEVPIGNTLDLLITVGNTGAANITANRVRPRITVPTIVEVLPNAQQTGLPSGWSIVSNTTQAINICNGTDIIPVNGNRDIIIKVKGVSSGSAGSSVQLFFGGTGSCTATGPAQNSNVNDDAGSLTLTVVAAVPLILTDFSSTIKDCQPILNWTTTSEINTNRFEIERSNESGSDWKMIGTVNASTYSSSRIDYNYIDKDFTIASEKIFYRLKMIDKDGSFKYSKILPVFVNCKTAKVLVYPIPVQTGKLFISIAGTVGNAEANLVSMAGQIILRKKIINGINDLDVTNIADGIFMLHIKDEQGFDKIIKVSIGH